MENNLSMGSLLIVSKNSSFSLKERINYGGSYVAVVCGKKKMSTMFMRILCSYCLLNILWKR